MITKNKFFFFICTFLPFFSFFVSFLFFSDYFFKGAVYIMPQFIKKNLSEAIEWCEKSGISIRFEEALHDQNIDLFEIFEQFPEPYSHISSQEIITLRVNIPPKKKNVPSVVGLLYDEGKSIIEKNGYRAIVEDIQSFIHPSGIIVAQGKLPGTTTIFLFRAAACKEKKYIGLLKNKSVGSVQKRLLDHGIKTVIYDSANRMVERYNEDEMIMYQIPQPGSLIDENMICSLWINDAKKMKMGTIE